LIRKFPKLLADGAKKTSEATRQYNCIAWSAARDELQWWEPEKFESWYYWPPIFLQRIILSRTLFVCFKIKDIKNALVLSLNFYTKRWRYTPYMAFMRKTKWGFSHVCDQLNSGAWTSKLGQMKILNIIHSKL